MAPDYFFEQDGRQHGPFSPPQLKELAASGRLRPADLVWKDGMERTPARLVKGLMPPAGVAGGPPPPHAPSDLQAAPAAPPAVGQPSTPTHTIGGRLKAAGQLAAKQAQRTALLNVTLPGAHRALGRHVHEAGAFREELGDLHSQLDGVLTEIQSVRDRAGGRPAAEGLGGKVKAAATAGRDVAQTKALELKVGQVSGRLGEAAFERHGERSGPPELVGPVREARSRLAALDAEIAGLHRGGEGQVLTPKRIVVGGAVAILLGIASVAVVVFRGGPPPPPENPADGRSGSPVATGQLDPTGQGAGPPATSSPVARTTATFTPPNTVDGFVGSLNAVLLEPGNSGSVPEGINCNRRSFVRTLGRPTSEESAGPTSQRRVWRYDLSDGSVRLLVDGQALEGNLVITFRMDFVRPPPPTSARITREQFKQALADLGGRKSISLTEPLVVDPKALARRVGPPVMDSAMKDLGGLRRWTYECSDGELTLEVSPGVYRLGTSGGLESAGMVHVRRLAER